MKKRLVFSLLLAAVLAAMSVSAAFALDPSTLYNGCKGDEVKKMQQALIDLGYLGGYADGIFGLNTENAVRKFQSKNNLNADGLAGKKTLALIYSAAGKSSSGSSSSSSGTSSAQTSAASQAASDTSAKSASTSGSSSLFSGNYSTLRPGASGNRVKVLQEALIAVGVLSGTADGKYGAKTREAVKTFQKASGLDADGLAGKKTLTALEKKAASGEKIQVSTQTESSSGVATGEINDSISAPSVGDIKLMHWYDDVKPILRNKQKLLIYDPATKLSWTLQILSRGRHCDAEPLTRQDTNTMNKAFGNQVTWDPKKVYVRLPNGEWTIGTTHNHAHDANTIKDNGFNGHLCVHFLRNMAETEEKDPNYGVTNQNAIRQFWKSLTGQEIDI